MRDAAIRDQVSDPRRPAVPRLHNATVQSLLWDGESGMTMESQSFPSTRHCSMLEMIDHE